MSKDWEWKPGDKTAKRIEKAQNEGQAKIISALTGLPSTKVGDWKKRDKKYKGEEIIGDEIMTQFKKVLGK